MFVYCLSKTIINTKISYCVKYDAISINYCLVIIYLVYEHSVEINTFTSLNAFIVIIELCNKDKETKINDF